MDSALRSVVIPILNVLLYVVSPPLAAQPIVVEETLELTPLTPMTIGGFGTELAVDFGAGVVTIAETNAVYIFRDNAAGWVEEQKLSSPIPGNVGFHVCAVAGDAIAIGAPDVSIGCISCSNGAVYLYRFNGAFWAQEAMFAPVPPDYELGGGETFGEVVVMDGSVLAVGAPDHDVVLTSGVTDYGSVHVYRDNGVGGYVFEQMLSSNLTYEYGHAYGRALALDGDVLVVGDSSVGDLVPSAGRVYVYRYNGSSWVEEQVLGGAIPHQKFGSAVAVRGSVMAIGASKTNNWAGAVHIYRHNGTQWVEEQTLFGDVPNTSFGDVLTVGDDKILVGQPGYSIIPGKVRVFRLAGGSWTETEQLVANGTVVGSDFGLALAEDGSLVIVGEPTRNNGAGELFGAAWLFSIEPAEFRRGDANDDGSVDIGDAIASLGALFVPGAPAIACVDAGDANDDGAHNVADAIYSLGALFIPGAPSPPAPFPGCGEDPTPDALPCGVLAGCP